MYRPKSLGYIINRNKDIGLEVYVQQHVHVLTLIFVSQKMSGYRTYSATQRFRAILKEHQSLR